MEIRPILSALLRSKTGAILVALQVAISLAILSNALHIVNLRQGVAARPSGIADEHAVIYANVRHLRKGSSNEQLAEQQTETDALRAISGVTSVAFVSQMPLSRSGSNTSVVADRKQVNHSAIASTYLSPDSLIKTLGLKLVEGRDFRPDEVTAIDNDTAPEELFPPSVIVTRALAEKVWPGAAGFVGKTLYFGIGAKANGARVVGVLDQLQTQGAQLAESGGHSVILPIRITNGYSTLYAMRTEPGQRERILKEADAVLRKASATPIIVKMRSVDADRNARYRADIALSWMLITVSVLLLLVTSSGIVGIASLWVTQRRKQIGVRRALGARRVDILRYFLTENFMITSAGVLAGVLLAIGLNQVLVSQLEMAKLPLVYLWLGAGVFWALGVVAVYGPAWRAATISPATATRSA